MNLSRRPLLALVPFAWVLAFLVLPLAAQAQLDMGDNDEKSCATIEKLRAKGDIPGARDAATTCLAFLEREVAGTIEQFFLEEVAGWKRGRFEQSEAMGIRNASTRYTKNDKVVNVSLIGGGSGRGLGGALSGLARMGMMGGGRQIKIAGLPANVMPNGQVMVSFEDGSMLNFECNAFKTADEALEGMGDLLDKFPVAKIRDALAPGQN